MARRRKPHTNGEEHMDDNGTVRMKKPLAKAPANDVSETVEALGGVRENVLVTEAYDGPPDEEKMLELRDEMAKHGLRLLQKLEEGSVTPNQARYQLSVHASLLDCGYETTYEQRDELMRVGFRSAG